MRGHLVPALLAGVVACSAFSGDEDPPAEPGVEAPDGGGTPDTGIVRGQPGAFEVRLAAIEGVVPILQGDTTKLQVSIVRGAQQKGPVVLRMKDLRDGITAAEVTLTGDSGELAIVAPAGAKQGAAKGVIEAVSKNGDGKDQTVSTPLEALVRGKPGTPDTTWGTDGRQSLPVAGCVVDALALGADDSVFTVGNCATQSSASHFDASGKLLTAYGSDGTGQVLLALANPTDAAVQKDGKLIALASRATQFGANGALQRLLANGGYDMSFGEFFSSTAYLNAAGLGGTIEGTVGLAIRESDGAIFVAWDHRDTGSFSRTGMTRLNADGSVHAAFGTMGKTSKAAGLGVAILVRNDPASPSKGNPALAWVNGNTFNFLQSNDLGGTDPLAGAAPRTYALGAATPRFAPNTGFAVLPDGSSVIFVNSDGRFYLAKFDPVGGRGAGFGTSGLAGPFLYEELTPNGIAAQPDGKLLVSRAGSSGRLSRFTAAGVLDETFGTAGNVDVASSVARKVVVQKSGRILVGLNPAGPGGAGAVAAFWP